MRIELYGTVGRIGASDGGAVSFFYLVVACFYPRRLLFVKTRLVIYAFPEQFGTFLIPLLECLNRRFVAERSLRNAMVVNLDVIAQRRLQLGS
jgi:hypothetical protein